MKRITNLACLIGGLLLVASGFAEENPLAYDQLELTDGRKLTKVSVKTYDPAADKVLLMAGKTAMKVSLELLPAAIRERVKEAAPRAGASTSSTASAPLPPPQERPLPPSRPRPVIPQPAPLDAEAHKQAALARARNYYRYEFQAGSNSIRVTAINFETDDPEAVSGWTDRYCVRGRVLLEFFDSRGYSYNRTTDRFEIQTEQKPGASIKVIDFTRK